MTLIIWRVNLRIVKNQFCGLLSGIRLSGGLASYIS